jgi:ATP-dependent DNA helicase RecQ
MPTTETAMKKISGVGDKKFASYGETFIKAITNFIQEQDKKGSTIQGSTQQITFSYYTEGLPIEEIAKQRDLKVQTIYSHLADLYEKGYEVTIADFVTESELNTIIDSFEKDGIPEKLKSLHERLNGAFEYHQLRFAIAHYKKITNKKQLAMNN